jgi:hypothetical protein
VFTSKPYAAPLLTFSFGVVEVFSVSTTKTFKITMDPAKLAKLQAQAASNRIGEPISPSKFLRGAKQKLILLFVRLIL